jgi:hypothetical protein
MINKRLFKIFSAIKIILLFLLFRQHTMQVTNDWIEEAISKRHIKYYEYEGFRNIQRIGKGYFAEVYRANWKKSEQCFALKSLVKIKDATVKEEVI